VTAEHVVIIGGGLAGLAAAAALGDRGIRVTLCESRPRWGGRASSFVDQTTGEPVDNCQHVSLGCCTNFRHFCQTIGIDGYFCREKELVFIGPEGRASRMAAWPLPAPLHLAPAFAGLRFLSWNDKYHLARGLRALSRTDPATCDGATFLDWLRRHGQTEPAIDRFWHVVLVSALSESLDRIDVFHARKVFIDAFLANRHGWEVWLPTVPLDDLYGTRLAEWFAGRNVTSRLQCAAKRVVIENSPGSDPRAVEVELRSGERIAVDHVILAVPQNLVLALLPDEWQSHPQFAGIGQLETAPISSVHLWFDRPITDLRHATFVGRLSQWIFNRSAIQGGSTECPARHQDRECEENSNSPGTISDLGFRISDLTDERQSAARSERPVARDAINHPSLNPKSQIPNPKSNLHYYQVVISASRDVLEHGKDETVRKVVEELAGIWPIVREARLVHSRLVTEHKAVVSMLPGVDKLRPPQQSPIGNVQLAGDWTQTGWPGTMEGAVRSGYLAAENVLRCCGRPAMLMQADLPVALLSKLMFGL
jgi:squalene-associated FAD-dependent desaturase